MSELNLTTDEKKILLQTARKSIESRLFAKMVDYPEPTPTLHENCGAFVTLHLKNNLRGCIGYVTGIKPLFETVKEIAQAAAFSDPRFPTLSRDEFPKIEIEISVLSPLMKINDFNKIEVGKHGLMVHKGIYSGLLLPQVATEYHWNRDQFLSHTCQKAGLSPHAWKTEKLDVEIFTALVFNERELGLI